MLRFFSLLFSILVLVISHPTTGDTQTFITDGSSSDYQGWFDPRINGGRFLDVRLRSGDVDMIQTTVTHVPSNVVH